MAERSGEFDRLNDDEIKVEVDKIARKSSYKLSKMLNRLNRLIGDNKINQVLSSSFDSFNGHDVVKVLQAGYTECRYPVHSPISDQFPIEGTDMHWAPLYSSGLSKFVYEACRVILEALLSKFEFGIPRSYIDRVVLSKDSGERFCRLFFKDNIDKYTIIDK